MTRHIIAYTIYIHVLWELNKRGGYCANDIKTFPLLNKHCRLQIRIQICSCMHHRRTFTDPISLSIIIPQRHSYMQPCMSQRRAAILNTVRHFDSDIQVDRWSYRAVPLHVRRYFGHMEDNSSKRRAASSEIVMSDLSSLQPPAYESTVSRYQSPYYPTPNYAYPVEYYSPNDESAASTSHVIVVHQQPPAPATTSGKQTYSCHIFWSCFTFWLCWVFFGTLSFFLACKSTFVQFSSFVGLQIYLFNKIDKKTHRPLICQ